MLECIVSCTIALFLSIHHMICTLSASCQGDFCGTVFAFSSLASQYFSILSTNVSQ